MEERIEIPIQISFSETGRFGVQFFDSRDLFAEFGGVVDESIEIPISIAFSETGSIDAKFNDSRDLFAEFGSTTVIDKSPTYDGDYIVTPKVIEQMLPTKDKRMIDDVTVLKIPYYETINVAGGNTVFIANSLGD